MREAYDLARSGHHTDYLSIEGALSAYYPEAREWLDQDSLRADLKAACTAARKVKDEPGQDH